MKYAKEIREKLCKEADNLYEKGGQLKMSDVDLFHTLTDTIKNLDKIEMFKGEDMSHRSMSYDDMSMRRGRSYDDESYARRGQHYVRAHYSYGDESLRNDMTNARDRRYTYADAKDHMLNKIGELMEDASPKVRESLKHAMHQIQDER